MKTYIPRQITLVSSNVAASSYAEWSEAHGTYSVGENVKITASTGMETEYECLVTHTSSSDNNPETDTTNWLKLGASNRWKMFDDFVSSQTENANSITVTFSVTDFIDGLSLFNLAGESVAVVVRNNGTEVYSETVSLSQDHITNAYEYFFSPFRFRKKIFFTLPGLYKSMEIELTVTACSGELAKIGHCVVSMGDYVGETEYGLNLSIDDYSVISTNSFGETYFNKRESARVLSIDLWVDTPLYNATADRLEDCRSTPCVWQCNNSGVTGTSFDALFVYGFYESFSLLLGGPVKSACSLEIKGLI